MKIEIENFKSIQKRAKTAWKSGTALISIGDTDAPEPVLEHKPEWILRLVFDDIYIENGKIKKLTRIFSRFLTITMQSKL